MYQRGGDTQRKTVSHCWILLLVISKLTSHLHNIVQRERPGGQYRDGRSVCNPQDFCVIQRLDHRFLRDISTDMQVYFVNTVHGRCHEHENIAKKFPGPSPIIIALCVYPHCKMSIGQYTKMCTSLFIFFQLHYSLHNTLFHRLGNPLGSSFPNT